MGKPPTRLDDLLDQMHMDEKWKVGWSERYLARQPDACGNKSTYLPPDRCLLAWHKTDRMLVPDRPGLAGRPRARIGLRAGRKPASLKVQAAAAAGSATGPLHRGHLSPSLPLTDPILFLAPSGMRRPPVALSGTCSFPACTGRQCMADSGPLAHPSPSIDPHPASTIHAPGLCSLPCSLLFSPSIS